LGLAVLAALWLMPGGLALAATITVTTVADENGSGPNCSLREAIASANGDADVGGCVGVGAYGADTIVFASTLSLPATIPLTDPASALTISSDVTITGPGATQLAIDGNHTTQVFSITAGQVMLSDLTIQHGGGGIDNNGTLTLTNCTLSGNSAPIGGGIRNSATLTVTDSIFSGNSADIGGGISNTSGEGAAVTGSTFSGNSAADSGGGIFNIDTILTVSNSTFSGNTAAGFVSRPVAGGGGIANQFACSGICSGGCGSVIVTNSTFSGNSADAGAGGIDGGSYGCPTSVTNSIIASSSGVNCGGGIIDGGHNLQFPGTSCGATIPSLDPLLGPLANNGGPTHTIAVLPNSPAINAGDPEGCANPPVNGVDQRGYMRTGTGYTNCSIGAYEYNSSGPPPSCVGDCGGEGQVTIDELLTMVNIALGTGSMAECKPGDDNDDGQITIDEILRAVNAALNGCCLDGSGCVGK